MPTKFPKSLLLALLVLVPSGIFIFYFATDQFINSYDTLNLFYVGKRWFWTEIGRGHFPQWNENLFGGFDLFASPANGILSPISAAFYFIFPGILAEELQLPLFAVTAAVGMFLWLKRLTGSEMAALLGALGYALSGPLLSLADRSHIFFSVCLYPWAFLCFDRLVEGRRSAIGCLAAVLAMMIIHADWVAVCILILLFAAMSINHGWKILVQVGLSSVWAIGLSALALFPGILNVGETTRAGGFTLEQTSYYSLHPLRLLNLLLPEAWGQPYNFSFYGQAFANGYKSERFWYHSIYVGLPILVLALGGLGRIRRLKYGIWSSAIAVGFLLLAFGKYFPLHEFLFHALPGYSKLRFPEKFLLYSIFALFPLAAITAATIRNWRPWLVVLAGLEGLAFITPFFWNDLATHVSTNQHWAHAVLALAFAAAAITNFQYVLPLFIALTVGELWLYSPVYFTAPIASFGETSPFTEPLRGNRYLRDTNLDSYVHGHPLRAMVSNWPMLMDLHEVFGYESITPFRSEALVGNEVFNRLEAWAPVLNMTHVVSIITPKPDALKRLGEKGLIEPVALDADVNAVLLAIHRRSREFSLLCHFTIVAGPTAAFEQVRERMGVLEPLIVEGSLQSPAPSECGPSDVQLVERTSERRVYKIQAQSPMWLVERESFNSGWKAYIDGVAADMWHLDYVNRGFPIPPGSHLVETRFEPRGFHFAAWLSLLSAILLVLYFSICAKRTIPQLSRST